MIARLLAFSSLLSVAQAAEITAPASAATIYAGAEWGDTDSQRADMGGMFRYRDTTDITASVGRARAALPEDETTSTYAMAKVAHDFGRLGLGAGWRRGEVEDISTTQGWFASAFVDVRDFRVGAEIETRDSKLARTTFTEDLGGDLGIVSGSSQCDVASIGYLLQLNLSRPRWSLNAAARGYDYADFDCTLTETVETGEPTGGPPADIPHARGRALGRRLANGALQSVNGFTSRLMPRESTLLKSTLSLGVMVPINDRWYGGVDLYRDVEKFADNAYATALAYAGLRVTGVWTAEFSVGHSSASEIEDTTFLGLRVMASL
jgi:hypothetical protein